MIVIREYAMWAIGLICVVYLDIKNKMDVKSIL